MDAFDRFWQWADKRLDSDLTIPAELQRAGVGLSPGQRRNRGTGNGAAAPARSSGDDGGRC